MENQYGYPRLLRRLLASVTDGIIFAIVFMGTLITASYSGIDGRISMLLAIMAILILEPLLVTVTGGTLGHHLFGLRVIDSKSGRKINIFAALIRFAIKSTLGMVSVIFVFLTCRYQAMHDGFARSVVILAKPEKHKQYDVLAERQVEDIGYQYPSVTARVVTIVIYNALLIYAIGTITGFILPAECLSYGRCSSEQDTILLMWQLLWLLGIAVIIVLCWKGRLIGCRRSFNETRD